CRDRRQPTRDPGSQKTLYIRAMTSTRIAERARGRISRWWIGRHRSGDHSDAGHNQTDAGPVPATEGLAEKPPTRDRNRDEGERNEGITRTERDVCQQPDP